MKHYQLWALMVSGLCASAYAAHGLPNAPNKPAAHPISTQVRLRFDATDVSDVLQALSLKTHANIVFSSQIKRPISINVAAGSTEEALRYVTAAAGLAYRSVNGTYVVAPPTDLRQALEPFGERVRIGLNTLTADNATKMLQDALPFLTARPVGGEVLLIGAPDDIAQARTILAAQDKPQTADPQGTDVVLLQHVPAAQVANLVKTLYPGIRAEAVGSDGKAGGAIGLSGPQTQLASAKESIRQMDVTTEPRSPDKVYRIYNIKYSSALVLKQFLSKAMPDVDIWVGPTNYAPPAPAFHPLSSTTIGSASGGSTSGSANGGSSAPVSPYTGGGTGPADMGMPGAAPAGGSGGQIIANDQVTTLVLNGAPDRLEAAFKLLDQVDVAPQQVMVEVKVVDTSPEKAEQLGFTWNWTPFNFLNTHAGANIDPSSGLPTPLNSQKVGFGTWSQVPWSLQSMLSAMTTRKEAKILADPRIQVINNEDANIFIGDTIRTQVAQSSLSGTTIQVLEFPVGIVLLVHPRINADGKITMRVHPVVSTITGISSGGIPNSSSREAETTVMVQDGGTVAIGGLIRDEISKTVTEVPILSKLPLIGELFRNRSTDHTHSDVLIFITPHIVK